MRHSVVHLVFPLLFCYDVPTGSKNALHVCDRVSLIMRHHNKETRIARNRDHYAGRTQANTDTPKRVRLSIRQATMCAVQCRILAFDPGHVEW